MAAALTALTALARAATRWFESPPDSLEAPALAYQRSVGRALNALPRGALVERALRGRAWLGHPLHPCGSAPRCQR